MATTSTSAVRPKATSGPTSLVPAAGNSSLVTSCDQLMAVCTRIASSTLPRVWLKTQVMITEKLITLST